MAHRWHQVQRQHRQTARNAERSRRHAEASGKQIRESHDAALIRATALREPVQQI
jgi:hypothetical protein